ncbi:MAG: hypothetical protein HQM13_13695 [SAR324 cluster bacterium]|nr:hypothetical protein [SAR324 cluster bacterium]
MALLIWNTLQDRLEIKGYNIEWADVINDLEALQETEVTQNNKRFLLRSEVNGTCGKVFQAAGVAIPPTIRQIDLDAIDV